MLFIKDTVLVCCLSYVQSHSAISLSLELYLLFANFSELIHSNLHKDARCKPAQRNRRMFLLVSSCDVTGENTVILQTCTDKVYFLVNRG